MSEYITTHEELLKLHGAKVTCVLLGSQIDDAKICVNKDNVYVCQNEKNGASANNTFGYKYSWKISDQECRYGDSDWGCKEIKVVKTDDAKVEPVKPILKSGDELNAATIVKKLDERLDTLTPSVILEATKTWDNFTKVWNELYHKAEKIKSVSSLEKFTRKVKELAE